MSRIILQDYTINDDELYVNGRRLADNNSTISIVTTSKDTNSYNVDLYVEYGKNINIPIEDITLEDIPNNLVVTKVNDKVHLVQLVRLPSDNIDLKLHIGKYNVNITIQSSADTSVLVPNIRTADNISLTPNGATEYPLSNIDMPIPIADNLYRMSWLVNNKRYTLGTDNGIDVKIFTNKKYLTIDNNKLNQPDKNSINDIELKFDYNIDTPDIKKDTYVPLVVEFIKNNQILSSRVVMFVNIPTILVDQWLKPYEYIELEKLTNNISYKEIIREPNIDVMVTPYVRNIETIWPEAYNIARRRYRLIPDNSNIIQSNLNLLEDNHLELNIRNESNINKNSYIDLSFYIGTVLIRKKHQRLYFREKNTESSIKLIDRRYNITIENNETVTNKKYNNTEVEFEVINGANITVNTDLEYDIEQYITYNNELPFNNSKVYPKLKGKVIFNTENIDPSDHPTKINVVDIDNKKLVTSNFLLKMLRPDANIITSLDNNMFHIHLEGDDQTITVNNRNIFKVNLSVLDPNIVTATLENENHSADLLETGTYDTYDFNIKLHPVNEGITNLTITLSDDEDNITKTITKPIEVYSTTYTPVQPDPSPIDNTYGCKVEISYTKEEGYTLPLAFVNNGVESEYVLVAKYPINQNSYKEDKDTRSKFVNISKLGQPRLEYVEENKIGDNTSSFLTTNFITITNTIKENDLVPNSTVVINSAYIDTMLANLADAHAYKCYINKNYNTNVNDYVRIKVKDSKDYQPYLNTDMNTSTIDNNIVYIGNKEQDNPTIVMYGVKNNDLDDKISDYGNKEKMYRFPLTGLYNGISTHNGQANGVVEPFGFGIKTYSDVKIKKLSKNSTIHVIDPYTTDRAITDETDRYTKIQLDTGKYMVSTKKSINYIGLNDYSLPNNVVYSNVDYTVDSSDAMLSNIGLPINTDINKYKGNNSIHNKGYNNHKPLPKFCNSIYSYNVEALKTEGYLISGTTLNNKLVLTNNNENKDKDYINNKYSYLNDVTLDFNIGSYRSRILIDKDTNIITSNTSDQMLIDQRVSFILTPVLEKEKEEDQDE